MRKRVFIFAALAMLACHSDDKTEICNDAVDNDDDGLVDCADDGCPQGTACSDGLVCSEDKTCATCTAPVPEQCADGIDNDCDGASDCEDTDCTGSIACVAPTESCTEADSAGRIICLTATRVRLPADGVSTADIEARLVVRGVPSANASCGFTLSGAASLLDGGLARVEKKTDVAGRASVVFGAGQNSGRAVVAVSCTTADQASSVDATISMELFGMGSMRVVSSEFSVLGARGSAYQEHTTITFQLLTEDGVPYPAGALVDFTHQSQGGSFIGNVPSCEAKVCSATARTDAEGMARVLLTSGRTFAVLTVEAEASAGGRTAHGVAGGFPVVGAKANGAHLSLDCRPWNVPAFTAHDCLYSHYKGKAQTVDCTVSMADRYGTVIGVPTLAAFQSEAGNVGPAAFTLAYDRQKPAADQLTLGRAVSFLSVYGHPLPRDVAPDEDAGEMSVELTGDAVLCGVQSDVNGNRRLSNPRDGLVTVIAIVAGEEGWVDENLDGEYTPGEPFIDIGEPFVDADDNGVWSADEYYEDVNSNGTYDGPNGKWDANTHLWTQERVLYTGYPAFSVAAGMHRFSRFFQFGLPMPHPTPTFQPEPQLPRETEAYGIFFTDERLNPLSAFTTFEATAPLGYAKVSMIGPDNTADSRGSLFRLLYCDAPAAPRTCFDGPADAACRAAATNAANACYVKPSVSHFTHGNTGTVYVTCPPEEGGGSEAVTVTTDLEGVKNSLVLRVDCLPVPPP